MNAILLQAQSISNTPSGGVSWAWVQALEFAIIPAVIFLLYKMGMYIVNTYLRTNEMREEANKLRHHELKEAFEKMSEDRKGEMQKLTDIYDGHEKRITVLENKK